MSFGADCCCESRMCRNNHSHLRFTQLVFKSGFYGNRRFHGQGSWCDGKRSCLPRVSLAFFLCFSNMSLHCRFFFFTRVTATLSILKIHISWIAIPPSFRLTSDFPTLSPPVIFPLVQNVRGARGRVFGWSTMLQAGRSRVRVPRRWIFFDLPNPSSRTMALGSNKPLNINEHQESSWGGGAKGGRLARKADNFSAICEPVV
jgi:hypothetical protein